MVNLSFAHVLRVLGALHFVPAARDGALKGRVQNLQRLKFPAGMNTGRGKPAEYGVRPLVHLLLAFELMQFGLGPERAAKMVNGIHPPFLAKVAGRAGEVIAKDYEGGEEDDYLIFDPLGLATLADPNDDGSDVLASASSFRRSELGAGLLGSDSDAADRITGHHNRFAVINLTMLLQSTARHIEEQADISAADFGHALTEWAIEQGWNPDDD